MICCLQAGEPGKLVVSLLVLVQGLRPRSTHVPGQDKMGISAQAKSKSKFAFLCLCFCVLFSCSADCMMPTCINEGCLSTQSAIQRPFTDTSRNSIYHLSRHPLAQSRRHTQLTITLCSSTSKFLFKHLWHIY